MCAADWPGGDGAGRGGRAGWRRVVVWVQRYDCARAGAMCVGRRRQHSGATVASDLPAALLWLEQAMSGSGHRKAPPAAPCRITRRGARAGRGPSAGADTAAYRRCAGHRCRARRADCGEPLRAGGRARGGARAEQPSGRRVAAARQPFLARQLL
eukprot:scaffold708_cov70-Phaeocystis_antarctica.AAC.1